MLLLSLMLCCSGVKLPGCSAGWMENFSFVLMVRKEMPGVEGLL